MPAPNSKKTYAYVSPRTLRQIQTRRKQRGQTIRKIFEDAIEKYARDLPKPPAAPPPEIIAAQELVRRLPKNERKKLGTIISFNHREILNKIPGFGQRGYLSDTLEAALTYFLWKDPVYQQGRGSFESVLHPPFDPPAKCDLSRLLRECL